MKRITAILLSVLMLCLSLVGCFARKSSNDKQIVGVWKATIDLTDYINESSGNDELSEYIKIGDFSFQYYAEFKEEGTYSFQIDKTAAEKMYEQVRNDFIHGVEKYFNDMINKNNVNMTVEELLSKQGTSLEKMAEDAFSDDKLEDMIKSLENMGNYTAKDGKLAMSPNFDTKPSGDVYEEYVISGTTMTITEGTTTGNSEFELFPMVFEKVS